MTKVICPICHRKSFNILMIERNIYSGGKQKANKYCIGLEATCIVCNHKLDIGFTVRPIITNEEKDLINIRSQNI